MGNNAENLSKILRTTSIEEVYRTHEMLSGVRSFSCIDTPTKYNYSNISLIVPFLIKKFKIEMY